MQIWDCGQRGGFVGAGEPIGLIHLDDDDRVKMDVLAEHSLEGLGAHPLSEDPESSVEDGDTRKELLYVAQVNLRHFISGRTITVLSSIHK
jgi:hypothetical protein